MNHLTIRLETEKDYSLVENLTREAFWNIYRSGCVEHFVLHRYRSNPEFVPELDFVMEYNDELIGHIMFVRATIEADDGRTLPIMTFGPMSIAPPYQRQGYGKMLLNFALDKATKMGVGAVCIEGNIDFYGKCGFSVAGKFGIRYHAAQNEEIIPYFLLRELKKGFLDGITGVYNTPQGYFIDESEAEAFERSFPHKPKYTSKNSF